MKQRYGEEQIIAILHEAEAAATKAEIYRKYGISEQTYYCWRQLCCLCNFRYGLGGRVLPDGPDLLEKGDEGRVIPLVHLL